MSGLAVRGMGREKICPSKIVHLNMQKISHLNLGVSDIVGRTNKRLRIAFLKEILDKLF